MAAAATVLAAMVVTSLTWVVVKGRVESAATTLARFSMALVLALVFTSPPAWVASPARFSAVWATVKVCKACSVLRPPEVIWLAAPLSRALVLFTALFS